MIRRLKRWCAWFFGQIEAPASPKVAASLKAPNQTRCHYTAEQWAFLRNATRGELRGLACHWGRSRSAIYEAWRKAQRQKEGKGATT